MSSIIPQLPSQIQIPGGPGAGPGDPGPGGPGGESGPDDADVVSLLKQALGLVQKAASAEKDDIDTAAIHKIAVAISSQVAAEQKLNDDVMGAGPGVKMIRKTAPAPGGGGPVGP